MTAWNRSVLPYPLTALGNVPIRLAFLPLLIVSPARKHLQFFDAILEATYKDRLETFSRKSRGIPVLVTAQEGCAGNLASQRTIELLRVNGVRSAMLPPEACTK